MDLNNFLTGFFIALGIILLIIIAYYIVRWFWRREEDEGQPIFPPRDYMLMKGAQCPDYWEMVGMRDGNVICRNKFGLPVHQADVKDKPYCKDVKCDKEYVAFQQVRRWPVNKRNPRIRQRCLWRDCCGPDENTPVAWVGLDGICS